MMIFENLVSKTFAEKVAGIASHLRLPSDHLMAVMWSESRLNPKAHNPQGGAVGLIQFMPATARHLGTSSQALLKMTAEQQLDYVERFFLPYAARCHSFFDLYTACFFPAAIGKSEHYVLQTRTLPAHLIARQNPGIDLNKDQEITLGEFHAWLRNRFPKNVQHVLFS